METVAIAVVPRDRFSMSRRCLEALYEHTNVPFRVVLVAGGTDETTADDLHRLQRDKDNLSVVLLDHLLTQGEARRAALEHVSERFCVILENDTIVHANWLSPLMECMREEKAAVVTPLIFWYRGIHAAGCSLEEGARDGPAKLRHSINYTGLVRKRIDYPETHCILIDRPSLPTDELFDEVEPFDVDLGLTLRRHGLRVFLEPRSVVTYSAPPPWEVRDIPAYRFRWDPASWETRNRRFMQKWGVVYDPRAKLASYRRQQLKIGLARRYPTRSAIAVSNVGARLMNGVQAFVTRSGHAMRRPWTA